MTTPPYSRIAHPGHLHSARPTVSQTADPVAGPVVQGCSRLDPMTAISGLVKIVAHRRRIGREVDLDPVDLVRTTTDLRKGRAAGLVPADRAHMAMVLDKSHAVDLGRTDLVPVVPGPLAMVLDRIVLGKMDLVRMAMGLGKSHALDLVKMGLVRTTMDPDKSRAVALVRMVLDRMDLVPVDLVRTTMGPDKSRAVDPDRMGLDRIALVKMDLDHMAMARSKSRAVDPDRMGLVPAVLVRTTMAHSKGRVVNLDQVDLRGDVPRTQGKAITAATSLRMARVGLVAMIAGRTIDDHLCLVGGCRSQVPQNHHAR